MSTTATVTNIALSSVTPVLTTTFVPTATTCTKMQLTMLANRAYQIWMNMPVPVAGTTMSDCYPSQYMTSYLLSAGGVTQPAFNPLVCPENWSTQGVFTSNYIACCPSGYGLAAPTVSVLSDRPAFGGTCYSDLTSGSSYLMTQYGSSSVTQTTYFPATTTGMQAYAYPIDGFAYGVNELQSQASTTTAVTASASTATASSTSNAGATYTVVANSSPTFTPSSIAAKINDTIVFQFNAGNHSATQSSFDDPCSPLSGGYDSGFQINPGSTTSTAPQASFKLLNNTPQFFYSKGSGDCGKGMVFVSNPSTEETESAFQSKAISMYGGSKSHSVAIGVGVGVSLGVVLLGALAFFFWRRNRPQRGTTQHTEVASADPDMYTGYNPEPSPTQEPKTPISHSSFEHVPIEEPPMPPTHELHNYSTPYEMGGQTPNAYELHGSQEYVPKR